MHVGTSGWQYATWRGPFYPNRLAQAGWLEHYAARFATVEVDNTFYRLPERGTFEQWAAGTPADFIVALKASRYLTHVRRLQRPEDPVALLLERARGLGDKLGPILLQLPPTLRRDDARLDATLASFPTTVRVAVEFRHASWFTEPVHQILADHGAALCLADRGSRPLAPLWRTTAWTYLRLHEGRARPVPCYGRTALQRWIERLGEQWGDAEDMFVYFNNDARCCAVRDARAFARLAQRAGLTVGRVPREVIAV